MEKTIKSLKTTFWGFIAVALLIVLLHECSVFIPGGLQMSDQAQFAVLTFMELLSLAVIPLALYLPKFKAISQRLRQGGTKAVRQVETLRLCLLGLPLVANTLLYYISGLNVAYGYMAIILVIVMPFVYPSKERLRIDTSSESTD